MKPIKTWIMLAPALLAIFFLFIIPIIYSTLLSFNFFSITSDKAINADAYWKVLTSKSFIDSLAFSLKIALISTVVSVIIAVIVSMALRRTFLGKSVAVFVYQFNIPVPHLVVAISTLLLLSQSGIVSRWFYALGVIGSSSDFPMLVFDTNGIGIMIAFILKSFPFIGIAVLSMLMTMTEDYEQQAATLGANRLQRFRYVILPMMMPSILFSSILVFAYAFGSYEVPFLLGSTYPKALSILAYEDFTDVDLNSRPEAMAIANIITLVIILLVIIAYYQLGAMNRRAVRRDG